MTQASDILAKQMSVVGTTEAVGVASAQWGGNIHIFFSTADRRWRALTILCLGILMICVDGTVVTVALPPIRDGLGFSQASISWVINAYVLPSTGFLLLGGRLGDLFDHRKVFLLGIEVFGIASLGCALATSETYLIAARVMQGIGGAAVAAAAQSLILQIFVDNTERAKVVGILGFVSSGGGIVGLLLGGVLTSTLGWRWIFLINIPVAAIVYLSGRALLPSSTGERVRTKLDILGAVIVTSAVLVALYATINASVVGWDAMRTLLQFGGALLLLTSFIVMERYVQEPLMPHRIFRSRQLVTSCIIVVLFSFATSSVVFCSLYMQLVLNYTPAQVGLAFLPSSLIVAVFALSLSAGLVIRFGIKRPLIFGLLLSAGGFAFLARPPADGSIVTDVLPGLVLVGLGYGMATNPLYVAATQGIQSAECGLISGLIGTFSAVGASLGLAVLATVSSIHTAQLLLSGSSETNALSAGYHLAYGIAIVFAVLAAGIAATLPRGLRISGNDDHTSIQVGCCE